MSIAFFVIAFVGSFLAIFRSLGWAFLAVVTVGYFSGVIRANYLGVFTTLMFDAAVFGLYLGFFVRKSLRPKGMRWGPAGAFVLYLIAWPAFMCLIPVNHFLIQCVALRAAIWFLPVLWIATRLTADDLNLLSRGLVVLNLVALAVGIYVYVYGVASLYPVNAVTQIIYRSQDVVGRTQYFHRVPSSFLSAHAYGGTMLYTLPFLVDRLGGVKVPMLDRMLAAAGIIAATGGLLMCGARSPLVILACALVVAWALTRLSLKVAFVVGLIGWIGFVVASHDERLQRVTTLADSETVSRRIAGSTNEEFLEILLYYPFGGGMGSAVGTSIPYFLAHLAPDPVGAENEYSRIVVDQGWLGLAGWLAMLAWLYTRPPPAKPPAPWRLGVVFMYSLTLTIWTTGFIGAGILTSIPGSFLLMTQMGLLIAVRYLGVVPETRIGHAHDPADVEIEADPAEVAVDDLGFAAGRDPSTNRSGGGFLAPPARGRNSSWIS